MKNQGMPSAHQSKKGAGGMKVVTGELAGTRLSEGLPDRAISLLC